MKSTKGCFKWKKNQNVVVVEKTAEKKDFCVYRHRQKREHFLFGKDCFSLKEDPDNWKAFKNCLLYFPISLSLSYSFFHTFFSLFLSFSFSFLLSLFLCPFLFLHTLSLTFSLCLCLFYYVLLSLFHFLFIPISPWVDFINMCSRLFGWEVFTDKWRTRFVKFWRNFSIKSRDMGSIYHYFKCDFCAHIFAPKKFKAKMYIEKSCVKYFHMKSLHVKSWWNWHVVSFPGESIVVEIERQIFRWAQTTFYVAKKVWLNQPSLFLFL